VAGASTTREAAEVELGALSVRSAERTAASSPMLLGEMKDTGMWTFVERTVQRLSTAFLTSLLDLRPQASNAIAVEESRPAAHAAVFRQSSFMPSSMEDFAMLPSLLI
jgi:hypothetical protein